MTSAVLARARRGAVVLALAAAPAAVIGVGSIVPASGANFLVTSNADSGPDTLREALLDADSNAENDVITVSPGLGTITLTTGALEFDDDGVVEIIGNGVTINANGATSGIFNDGGGDLSVRGVTITGIGPGSSDDAGAIVNEGGVLAVADCTITGNAVETDGGDAGLILSEGGALSVDGCTIDGNSVFTSDGDAGAVLSEGGSLSVTLSTITNNTIEATTGSAAAVNSEGGAVGILDSTIARNAVAVTDVDGAGGVAIFDSDARILRTTIECNTAVFLEGDDPDEDGLAGGVNGSGTVSLIDSTVRANEASGPADPIEQQVLAEVLNNDGSTITDEGDCSVPPPPPPPPPPPTFAGPAAPISASPGFTG